MPPQRIPANPDGSIRCNWYVDLTYRCNGGCPDCSRLLGIAPWPDPGSDLTEVDIALSGQILEERRMAVRRIRISGGEPLLHPRFLNLFRALHEHWQCGTIRVMTNGIIPHPWPRSGRRVFRTNPIPNKRLRHTPSMFSPADLGEAPVHGVTAPCSIMTGCGLTFSHYGFTFCLQAVTLGRLLGRDVFSAEPVLETDPTICRHCNCSLPKRKRRRYHKLIGDGEVEYPTRTYREGLERLKGSDPVPKTFLERIQTIPTESIGNTIGGNA